MLLFFIIYCFLSRACNKSALARRTEDDSESVQHITRHHMEKQKQPLWLCSCKPHWRTSRHTERLQLSGSTVTVFQRRRLREDGSVPQFTGVISTRMLSRKLVFTASPLMDCTQPSTLVDAVGRGFLPVSLSFSRDAGHGRRSVWSRIYQEWHVPRIYICIWIPKAKRVHSYFMYK